MSVDSILPSDDSRPPSPVDWKEGLYLPRNWTDLDDWECPTEDIANLTYLSVPLGVQFEKGRYVIVRKLGWGSWTTAWLARGRKTNTFVSLRILSSKATEKIKDGESDELDLIKRFIALCERDERQPAWAQHIGRFFDFFSHRTEENVEHLCMTMEPLAWDLWILKSRTPEGRFPRKTCKSLVRQILIALEGIHREMGYVFTDLKPNNVLIRPEAIASIIVDEMVVEPAITDTLDSHRYPKGMVRCKSQPLPPRMGAGDHIGVVPLHVVLVDFGEAREPGQVFPETAQNMSFRAPEVYLGYPATSALDIWSLGCLVFWLVTGGEAFDPGWGWGGIDRETGITWDVEEAQLRDMTDRLKTNIPIEMRERSQYWNKYLDEYGNFLRSTEGEDLTLKGSMLMVEETQPPEDRLPDEELEGWNVFMLRCLKIQPESRPSAAELLQDPWLHES